MSTTWGAHICDVAVWKTMAELKRQVGELRRENERLQRAGAGYKADDDGKRYTGVRWSDKKQDKAAPPSKYSIVDDDEAFFLCHVIYRNLNQLIIGHPLYEIIMSHCN